ncbi:transcription factor HES-4-A-like isoform X2 [Nematostella vectensis]|uniref:transcription factor HES-4-A-like isoform X2 n=1 Tax=Nematostella vectensis TaxID=45351 RepID=UPI002077739D|nr:transcription factor HES-4-A-like isoform X2 [Nematostella vectensis]
MKMVQDSAKDEKMTEAENDIDDRKWSKPVMEKRRRERINRSLEELKRLVLEAQHRDCSRYTKLEKADILEMTVKHLRTLQSQQKTAMALSNQAHQANCCAGCNGCAVTEVTQFMVPGQHPMPGTYTTRPGSFPIQLQSPSGDNTERNTSTQQPMISVPTLELNTNQHALPLTSDANGRLVPSYLCQTKDFRASVGTVPVRFIPVYSSDVASTLHAIPQALFPAGQPVGFPSREPLWRPF